ncbi:hypothetical protein [Streptomyces sp. KL116D]|uniref:hypothetical protein n=1 Tax=Streptomyces sp. KL116D TaxID=3045152 RepID=UPI00355842BF
MRQLPVRGVPRTCSRVAGPGDRLLIGRDAHKSVVSGLISGIDPVWIDPAVGRAERGLRIRRPAAYEEVFGTPTPAAPLVTSSTLRTGRAT